MASLRRVPGSVNWIACYYDVHGQRKQRSTGTSVRKTAQKIADSFEKPWRAKMTGSQVLDVMTRLYRQITGEDAPRFTLREYAESWLKRKRSTVGESTHSLYTVKLRQFIEFMGPKADAPLVTVEQRHVEEWRDTQVGRVAPKTINHGVKALRTFFKSARRERIITENPAEFVETVTGPRGGKTVARPFELSEIKSVLAVCGDEWRSMVLFALYTGQRLGDIAGLTWAQIDMERETIRITTRKTGRNQELPLAAPLREHIASLPAGETPTAPVHPKAYETVTSTGKAVTLSNQFADILAAAGLREKKPHRKSAKGTGKSCRRVRNALTFHSIRHTATSIMKNAGIPSAVVQDYIGHDSAEMSKLYTTIDMDAKRRAALALPSLHQINKQG